MREVVVLGAGMAGIACARALADAGRDVLVLDKGRGLGGRMASRRTERGPLDHGAPWLEASGPRFRAVVGAMVASGHAAPWRGAHVGLPGMSGSLGAMAEGIERRSSWEAREVRRRDGGWLLRSDDDAVEAREVVSTVPLPQARTLLGAEIGSALDGASMLPCWTLLAFVEGGLGRPGEDVAWLSDEGSKPGRPSGGVVLQATAAWTAPRLEMDRAEACEALTGLLPGRAVWAAAHRWRYSQADRPLGRPFVAAPGLRVGGDWCLGSKVEHAWESGTSMARDLLAAPGGAA